MQLFGARLSDQSQPSQQSQHGLPSQHDYHNLHSQQHHSLQQEYQQHSHHQRQQQQQQQNSYRGNRCNGVAVATSPALQGAYRSRIVLERLHRQHPLPQLSQQQHSQQQHSQQQHSQQRPQQQHSQQQHCCSRSRDWGGRESRCSGRCHGTDGGENASALLWLLGRAVEEGGGEEGDDQAEGKSARDGVCCCGLKGGRDADPRGTSIVREHSALRHSALAHSPLSYSAKRSSAELSPLKPSHSSVEPYATNEAATNEERRACAVNPNPDSATAAATETGGLCTDIGLALLPTPPPPAQTLFRLQTMAGGGSTDGCGREGAGGKRNDMMIYASPQKDRSSSFLRPARAPAATISPVLLLPPLRSPLPPAAPTLSPPSPNLSPVSPLALPGPASCSPSPAPLSPRAAPLAPLSPSQPPSGYPCRVCGALFASGPALGGHMRRHLSGGFEGGGKGEGGRWLEEQGHWEKHQHSGAGRMGREGRVGREGGGASLSGREQQHMGCEWRGRVGAAPGNMPLPHDNCQLLQHRSADADRMSMLARGVGAACGVRPAAHSSRPSLVLARGVSLARADMACEQKQQQQRVSAMLSQVQMAQWKRPYVDAMRWRDGNKHMDEREEEAEERCKRRVLLPFAPLALPQLTSSQGGSVKGAPTKQGSSAAAFVSLEGAHSLPAIQQRTNHDVQSSCKAPAKAAATGDIDLSLHL
ncbi:hypothetical protein CLOM_g7922 [Closterium sp. NIES-68]|nr:hypothetical protein CLOM_g7922 [Closterium sp. NIES-68]GJP60294.1 hypothetical protein CLOP_g17503 [Closterium sp. NIES-67]